MLNTDIGSSLFNYKGNMSDNSILSWVFPNWRCISAVQRGLKSVPLWAVADKEDRYAERKYSCSEACIMLYGERPSVEKGALTFYLPIVILGFFSRVASEICSKGSLCF